MRKKSRISSAALALSGLLFSLAPQLTLATAAGAQLEGLLLDVDGRPARGYAVHLIDARGADVGRSASDDDGIYSFRGLDEGRYSMGIEDPEGRIAPVSAPPIRLSAGRLARRDVKLVMANPAQTEAVATANYGLGMWWAGLSSAAKAWTIVGLVAIVGITVAALADDDDEPASQF